MYGFDIGMHVSDNLVAIEKKEKAEAQAKAKARAQAQAEIRAKAQEDERTHHLAVQPHQQQHDRTHSERPAQPQKHKSTHLNAPFNVFQAQMQKPSSGNARTPSPSGIQRPGAPNRTVSFPVFPSFTKPVTPVGTPSGLSSLAASAYNSPLPSPRLGATTNNAWLPFGPRSENGDSNHPSPK
ncbi:hypothetical protein AAFC00_000563 [Neodothiora populina]|uniref:Uncharacterized protein n=1 Tax=Neodothiora populina TaxID=2781224 RepID=A0ABR3PEI1_9PEZI